MPIEKWALTMKFDIQPGENVKIEQSKASINHQRQGQSSRHRGGEAYDL